MGEYIFHNTWVNDLDYLRSSSSLQCYFPMCWDSSKPLVLVDSSPSGINRISMKFLRSTCTRGKSAEAYIV